MSNRSLPILRAAPDPRKIQALYPGASANYSVAATPVNTDVFGADVGIIRICAVDAAVRYAVGDGAVATSESTYLPPGVPEYVAVAPGERLSMLQHSGTTQVNVTEAMGDKT